MDKLIRDGKVAVIVSPNYGAGWSTWNRNSQAMCMDERIVSALLYDDESTAKLVAKQLFPDAFIGSQILVVEWVPVGTIFEIQEYDGAETLRIIASLDDFMIA